MVRRSRARQLALQMLYQKDLNPDASIASVREEIDTHLEDAGLADFAYELFINVLEYRVELDARIAEVARNWTLERMAPTDRNALRIGAYELLHTPTPHRVVIDEAIELARMFGSENSTQFVNGILDKLVPSERRTP